MTASKSSRARNARAQATAARNGSSGAGRNGTATAVRGNAGRGTAAGGTAASRRGAAVEPEETDVPVAGTVPLWLQLTTFVIALAGLGVSIYLTIAHFTESALIGCSESGAINCQKVTTSPQSFVFGIPVAVLGLAFYVFAVAIMSPWAWRWVRREVYLLRLASVVVGIGFVVYLLYAELFEIGSICLYCTSVHILTFLLFGLVAFAAAAWGLPERTRS
jgi:uncharacterized membrane protein